MASGRELISIFFFLSLLISEVALHRDIYLIRKYMLTVVGFSSRFRPKRKDKDEFFLSHGAELLEKLIEFSHSRSSPIRIFSAEELTKATNNFAEKCEGCGYSHLDSIYYKGNLEGRAITVTTSRRTEPYWEIDEVSRRINEVAILSRINHPNVVKVVGCCLETSTPMLVHEELPNETLSWRLHEAGPSGYIPWQNRLKIVTEIAHALAYMHMGTATPIIHSDIRPSNILVGECFAVKIVGFEISKSMPLGEIKINCELRRTFCYADPVFVNSGELSEKSDVYSYGVLLLVVLSGQKSFDSSLIFEDGPLSNRFLKCTEEELFVSFLDSRVVQEAKKEQLTACLRLAERCVRDTWEERPEMKEVVQELWRIRGLWELPKTSPEVIHRHYECNASALCCIF